MPAIVNPSVRCSQGPAQSAMNRGIPPTISAVFSFLAIPAMTRDDNQTAIARADQTEFAGKVDSVKLSDSHGPSAIPLG